MSELSLSD